MRNIVSILLVTIFSLFTAKDLFAQGTATVTGQILEDGTGEPLFGANILVMGTNRGASTNIDGEFTLRNVPAGTQTVRVTYLGYRTIEEVIEVPAGETVEVSFTMQWAGVEGEEINITAQAQGQTRAINEQLASNTISNIVSRDRIQEIPDVNAAESIGRLPGVSIQRSGGEATKVSIRGLSPKYNTVSVNGVRVPSTGGDDRSVDLSLISSNMLDGIEVKKANTPDMDADALGGSIDLKLREAQDSPEFRVSAQGGYAELQDYYGNYKFNASGSRRFFDNQLGVIASFNMDEYDRSADKFFGNYRQESDAQTGERRTLPTGINLREENIKRDRIGASLVIDYKIPEGKINVNSFYNRLNSVGYNRIDNMEAGNQRHYYQSQVHEGTTDVMTGAFSIEQDFGFLRYDAGISRSNTSTHNPEDFSWEFSQEGEAFSSTPTFETDPLNIPTFATIDSTTPLANFNVNETEREENITTTQLNVRIPADFGSIVNGHFKLGGKFKWLDRFNDEEALTRGGLQYGGARSTLRCLDSQLPGGWNLDQTLEQSISYPINRVLNEDYDRDNFLGGDADFGFATRESKLRELIGAALDCGINRGLDPESDAVLRVDAIGSYGRDYDGVERYQAAYLMGEFQIGNYVKFIPGARWERDYSRYNGQRYREIEINNSDVDPSVVEGAFEDLTTERDNSYILPMVHLQIEPNDWLKLRLARTETLTRPDYIQYAPIASINVFRTYFQAANTQLKPALSKNYDASLSIYQNKIGLFTVSGFYKSIDDLILFVDYPLHRDVEPLEGLAIDESWIDDAPNGNTYINNPYEAEYSGIEFDWQTSFWYLPSVLKGLVLNLNYTYIQSETTYQSFYLLDSDSVKTQRPRTYYKYVETDSVRTGRMPDQPKHIANATIGYDYKGFSVRFSALYQSDISTFINSRNPIFDEFSGEYLRFDAALNQKFGYGFEVFLNLNNINGRPDRNYLGSAGNSQRPTYTEFYGFTMDMGVRFRL